MKYEDIRADHRIILGLINSHSSVLDLGCGTGELLCVLIKEKNARGQGIEIDEQAIYKCVTKGLNVFHGDIDSGLVEYRDKSFDYVILNQSFQQVKKPDVVLREALRVGKKVIVAFPNFAYYRARLQIFFKGKTPITPSLPYEWCDTPNLHFLSISDFIEYCRKRNINIEESVFIGKNERIKIFPNWFALVGLFLISNGQKHG
ncbi:MAG: methionine biosynthesis protein MetW [Candidatus Omnitrophota bacterium]|nr:methionine biosynthesis protein MetW [Candidatus Omnitrophota bacterium]